MARRHLKLHLDKLGGQHVTEEECLMSTENQNLFLTFVVCYGLIVMNKSVHIKWENNVCFCSLLSKCTCSEMI